MFIVSLWRVALASRTHCSTFHTIYIAMNCLFVA